MKTIIRYIAVLGIGAMALMAGSCSGDEPQPGEAPAGFRQIAANFNVGMNDYDRPASRDYQQWPDGACVMVYSATDASLYGFLNYSAADDKWTASFSTIVPTGVLTPCRLYYVPDFAQTDYIPTGTVVSSLITYATTPHYRGEGEFVYGEEELSILGTLNPRTGRLRLRAKNNLSIQWSGSTRIYSAESSEISAGPEYSEATMMTQDSDGLWYSPYLYVDYVPTIIANNNYYYYKDSERMLEPGMSAYIDVPETEESNDTWQMVKVFATGSVDWAILNGSNLYYLVNNKFYTSSTGFRLYGSFSWQSYYGIELTYDDNIDHPFEFVVLSNKGETRIYSPGSKLAAGTYSFDFDIDLPDIRYIYLRTDYEIYVCINYFTLLAK